MNARQQEPPSSHLHGAGHNTSISRQRRTTKQEEQSGQTRQGAGRAERNMRHNETFKCAMMVAWTSGRVRAKQRDRTT